MITFTLGILFFFNNAEKGIPDDTVPIPMPREAAGVIVDGTALDPKWNNLSTEDKVRAYFSDTPILAEIAWCESKFTHYDEYGNVKRGDLTPKDVGVMQINEYYHKKTADVLEMNLHTLEGNMEYAKWLYEREGTTPWNSSRHCWGNSAHLSYL